MKHPPPPESSVREEALLLNPAMGAGGDSSAAATAERGPSNVRDNQASALRVAAKNVSSGLLTSCFSFLNQMAELGFKARTQQPSPAAK